MATSSAPVAICSCRHTCDIAKGLLEAHHRKNSSQTLENDVQVGQRGNEDEIRATLLRYQEENIRLRSVIHDVTEVNKRWQKYNQERVGYVQKLMSTIKELQQKESSPALDSTNKSSSSSSRSSSPTARDEAAAVATRLRHDQVVVENTILRKELEECEKSYRHLNMKMDLSRQDFFEQTQVLEMQLKMHKDDWEAEKREKEEAHRMSEKLQEELKALKVKKQQAVKPSSSSTVHVCVCNTKSKDSGLSCRVVESLKRQSPQNDPIRVLPCQNIVRPPVSNGLHIAKSRPADGDHSVDSTLSAQSSGLSSSSSSSSCSPPRYVDTSNYKVHVDRMRRMDDRIVNKDRLAYHNQHVQSGDLSPRSTTATWKLICPKCRRVFPSNLHLQFTSHIEECQENMHRCSQ